MHRHARQTRLPEIGPAGQARLARARIDVPLAGFAGDVAVRYLAGAGVGALRVAEASLVEAARAIDPAVTVDVDRAVAADDAPSDPILRHPVARDLARGAAWALGALRTALDVDSSGAS